jgi:hypothetical protein
MGGGGRVRNFLAEEEWCPVVDKSRLCKILINASFVLSRKSCASLHLFVLPVESNSSMENVFPNLV